VPGALTLHLEGSLYTGNAQPTADAVLRAVQGSDPPVGTVVMEVSEVATVTVPFLDTLRALHEDLRRDEVTLLLAAMRPDVEEVARRAPWFAEQRDNGMVHGSVDAAVAAATTRTVRD
jgi:anti-anti-sigma regulatory factor